MPDVTDLHIVISPGLDDYGVIGVRVDAVDAHWTRARRADHCTLVVLRRIGIRAVFDVPDRDVSIRKVAAYQRRLHLLRLRLGPVTRTNPLGSSGGVGAI